MRPSGRKLDEIRSVKITRQFTAYAEGSVLIEFGQTKVICNASIEEEEVKRKNGHTVIQSGMICNLPVLYSCGIETG